MKHFNEEKEDIYALIFAELKRFGVKVPKVKKYKSGSSKQEKNPGELKTKIFGISLLEQEWISENGYTLPKFLAVSTAYLGAYTQVEIGLFRKAGSVARQRDLRAKLENGGNLDGSEPNDVASLLKQWLRELPEPVVPCYLHDLFVRCQGLEADDVRLIAVLLSCFLLPAEHLFTLKHLVSFLSKIAANSEINKMVPHNLAVIMAPNLLSSSCDRAGCKSGNDLVHCYTSLVELLILNAEKIGQIPHGISSKLSLKLGYFDFSIETLDCSPSKCKKRRRSGGVIDIVSGIRRLVGGNLTPMNNLAEMSDVLSSSLKANSAFTSETRSAPKRKADRDICPFTDMIKKQALPDAKSLEHIETLLLTPVGKTARFVNSLAMPVSGCTPVTHNRRKSFGLLKKKQQKKGKLVTKGHGNAKHINHLLSVPCNSVCRENELDINHESENKSCKMMDPLSAPKVIDLSPMIISYKSSPFLRVENPIIKRTQSDCPMSSQKSEIVSLCKLISASHEDLPNKKLSSNQLKNTSATKYRSPKTYINYDRSPAHSIRHASPKKKDSRVKHDSRHHSHKRNSIKRSRSIRNSSKKSPILDEVKVSPVTLDLFIKSTDSRKNTLPSENYSVSPSESISSKINAKYEEKQTCRNIARFSPNTKSHSELLKLKTPDTKGNKLPKVDELRKTSPSAKSKDGFKKGANKSSLKRGRPNTVKTGLPSDLCPKYSVDSISTLKSDIINKMTDFKSSHQKSNSVSLLSEGFSVEDNVFDDMDIKKSLNNEIEACVKEAEENISFYDVSTNTWLNLTPLENKQYDVSISFTDASSQGKETEASTYLNTNTTQSCDIKKNVNENDNLGNFCIKNRSEKLSKTYSHENLDKRVIKSKSKKRTSSTNINNLTPRASGEKIQCKVIVDKSESLSSQSFEKENEEIWINAENFLKTHLQPITPSENPAACKRESILQLMVRNAGKVQENVHHFNYMSVGSTPLTSEQISNLVSTSSNNSVSSPSIFEDKNATSLENTPPCFKQHSVKCEDRLSRKRLQSLKRNNEFNLACSESKLEKEKKVQKSPMRLPPKFVANSVNIYPNRGCPLKEVTNTNILKENLAIKNRSKINSPIETLQSPIKKKHPIIHCSPLHDNDLSIEINRHSSYSSSSIDSSKSMGIRCDSTPILNNGPDSNEFSPKSSPGAIIRPLQGHSQSFNSAHFHHTKKRSVATLPRQSLSNAMMNSLNQLYDEWECDM